MYDATLEYAFRSEARCCCCCCAAAAAAAAACCARLFAFVEPLGRPRPRFTTSPPGPRVGDDFAAFSNGSPGRGRFCGLRRPCAANEAVDGRPLGRFISAWSGLSNDERPFSSALRPERELPLLAALRGAREPCERGSDIAFSSSSSIVAARSADGFFARRPRPVGGEVESAVPSCSSVGMRDWRESASSLCSSSFAFAAFLAAT